MTDPGDSDNLIRIGGTELQLHQFELPTGSVVVGMGLVLVRLDGSLEAVLRCHGRGRQDRQVYYNVMQMALEDFRRKHELDAEDDTLRLTRSRG